jgi:hypothetical protein
LTFCLSRFQLGDSFPAVYALGDGRDRRFSRLETLLLHIETASRMLYAVLLV